MSLMDILALQLMDPFRIGLLVALVLTSARTVAATGTIVPMLLGLVFVAVLIPTTLGSGEADRTSAILLGLVSNAIILGVVLAAWALYQRLAKR